MSLTPLEPAKNAPPEKSGDGHAAPAQAKVERTPGLKLFDVFLYPVLTNFGVFGISVAATYLTNRGAQRDAAGKLIYGKWAEKIAQRGDWMSGQFRSMGMSRSQADMSKMVFFSWFDGSLLAPVVKKFEDHREHIADMVDRGLGTSPEDEKLAYKAEPKQSWGSVLGGRLATCAMVVPTAVALDKAGLNEKFFNRPGQRFGTWVARNPDIRRMFGRLDIPELGRVGAFELFYTSVCTTGLYFSSRFIAKMTGKDKEKNGVGESTAVASPKAPPEHRKTMLPDSWMTATDAGQKRISPREHA